jgi:hypothetical protein
MNFDPDQISNIGNMDLRPQYGKVSQKMRLFSNYELMKLNFAGMIIDRGKFKL